MEKFSIVEKKHILKSAGAFEWEIDEIFDSVDDMIKEVEHRYDISFEQHLEKCPNDDIHDWLTELDFQYEVVTNVSDKMSFTKAQLKEFFNLARSVGSNDMTNAVYDASIKLLSFDEVLEKSLKK